ncbi:SDR family NAD(P)-dependent oxidoreductase [Nonomuraea sp. C10]|uniref:SDR family NAD(P)-dependent oxidoreductase n=1 Tax=Nonomuraea sp. C10 TaxID=2600577 RepID=UPI001C9D32FD|nr:SDR family oxidoreductase [Nonomuraea sp. C10]
MMLLAKKNIVIYGGSGPIGNAFALTFAREGARVFLVGRTRKPLERTAAEVEAAGGSAHVAVLDALDERSVNEHVQEVRTLAGSVDVSVNLVSRGDVQGIPLIDMATDDFVRPITAGLTAAFVTARAAARVMADQGDGVILTLNSGSAHGSPMLGASGPADAATDTFIRNLAAEVGPRGVRVLGLWTAGLPESFAPRFLEHNPTRRASGMSAEDIDRVISGLSMLGRAPRLADVAETAAFLVSDRAGAITGAFVNATSGIFPS